MSAADLERALKHIDRAMLLVDRITANVRELSLALDLARAAKPDGASPEEEHADETTDRA